MATNNVLMPRYPKGVDRDFQEFVSLMIEKIADKFKKQALESLHVSTVEKFADAQVGNYAKVFTLLAKKVARKIIKQYSNVAIDEYCAKVLGKANKYNRDMTYAGIEKAIGINMKQLILKESMSPTINALILETSQWIKRLRDETLQNFTANSLRAMSLGNTIDGVLKEFDLAKSKQKNAAKFVARNQVANFNGILTKIRHQSVGIEEGIWITAHDERVRPSHKARDGKKFKLSEGLYSSIDQKYLIPGTDFNCRCIYKAIIKEFEGI